MYKCTRCNQPDAIPTKLFGGYHTKLCDSCLNFWNESLQKIKEWEEVMLYDAKRLFLSQTKTTNLQDLEKVYKEHKDLEGYFFNLAKDFITGGNP